MRKTSVNTGTGLTMIMLFGLLFVCCLGLCRAQTPTVQQAGMDHNHSSHTTQSVEETGISTGKLVIPDTEVVTQDGKHVGFYRDLIKGKKVLINFIYTSCATTCPMAGRNFEQLQKRIETESKGDVSLISVSTDPAVDTPSILKKWGDKFHRQNGWTLVTGDEGNMKQLLKALTGGGPQRGQHTSFLILYDANTGAWSTSSSLMDPQYLLIELGKLQKPQSD